MSAVAAVAVACCRCAPSHESRRTRLAANNIEIEAICLLLSRILRVIKKGARTATATATQQQRQQQQQQQDQQRCHRHDYGQWLWQKLVTAVAICGNYMRSHLHLD